MATFSNASEAFYDDLSGTSPRAFRNPQMSRQGRSDGYGGINPPMFANEPSLPSMRFDNMRDAFGAPMQNPSGGNVHFPYDPGAAQTWASSGGPPQSFGNGMGGMPQNSNYGPSRTVKPSRGRAAISNVSPILACARFKLIDLESSGMTSLVNFNNNIPPLSGRVGHLKAGTTLTKMMTN